MRLLGRLLWVFAVFSIGGCTQVTGPPPGTAPVKINVTVAWSPIRTPLDGVELCQADDTANCVLTDGNGEATLPLPARETSFTRRKADFGSYLIPLDVPVDGLAHSSGMARDTTLESLHEDVMSPYPMEGIGGIACNVGFAGATFDLFDATGKLMAKQYFLDEGPTWRLDVTETTSAGEGGFLEVSPGEYQIQFGGTAIDCVPVSAWPGLFLQNSVRFRVRAGYTTQISAACSQVTN